MDNASLPTTVDFEGPNSSLSKRHGIIRFERKYGKNNIAGILLNHPVLIITILLIHLHKIRINRQF
jgi:aspartyl aminopeptidase